VSGQVNSPVAPLTMTAAVGGAPSAGVEVELGDELLAELVRLHIPPRLLLGVLWRLCGCNLQREGAGERGGRGGGKQD
jgi:hypothetical protein